MRGLDHASEIAPAGALDATPGDALAAVRETWEPETTLANLRLLGEARRARGEEDDWLGEVEEALEEAARGLPGELVSKSRTGSPRSVSQGLK